MTLFSHDKFDPKKQQEEIEALRATVKKLTEDLARLKGDLADIVAIAGAWAGVQ